jgi:hypothetical protein
MRTTGYNKSHLRQVLVTFLGRLKYRFVRILIVRGSKGFSQRSPEDGDLRHWLLMRSSRPNLAKHQMQQLAAANS